MAILIIVCAGWSSQNFVGGTAVVCFDTAPSRKSSSLALVHNPFHRPSWLTDPPLPMPIHTYSTEEAVRIVRVKARR
jgi:hypothetical protein